MKLKKILFLLISILVLTLFPNAINAAEVLQVRSSTLLQLGDQNRSYSVQIACLNVESSQENEAIKFLRSELPRKTKVNLLPKGSKDGILIARVNILPKGDVVTELIISAGFGKNTCK